LTVENRSGDTRDKIDEHEKGNEKDDASSRAACCRRRAMVPARERVEAAQHDEVAGDEPVGAVRLPSDGEEGWADK
jgi:hypothetical protein